MAKFLISIIALNRLATTERCVKAILANSGKDFELVLTDNGSNDDTKEFFLRVARELEGKIRVRVFLERENTGFIPPNNRAFQLAVDKGCKFFVALNNDTVPPPGWLDKLASPLELNPKGALSGPYGGCSSLHDNFHGYDGTTFEYVEGSCLCVKVDIVKNHLPLFSDYLDFIYGDDSDLSLRMQQLGYTIHRANFSMPHERGDTVQRQPEVKARCDKAQEHNHRVLRQKWAHYLKARTFRFPVFIKRRFATGDCLLVTPLIRAIKQSNPMCRIGMISDNPEVFYNNPHLTWNVRHEAELNSLEANAIKIDLDMAYENRPNRHVVTAYEEAARECYDNFERVELLTERRISAQDAEWGIKKARTITQGGGKLCAIHVGPTNWPGKNWPMGRWADLCDSLVLRGYRVVAVGNQDLPQELEFDCVRAGGLSISQLIALLKQADLFIGIDSFPMHAAQVAGCHTIGLFGCTNPDYLLTKGSSFSALQAKEGIECKGQRHTVPGITFLRCSPECIESISIEDVLESVDSIP